jgi:hypothetical protein
MLQRTLPLAFVLAAACTALAADPYRYVITSATANQRNDSFEITSVDLPETGDTPWSIRQITLHGGRQEGVQVVGINNGVLQITLIPTRGMSIFDVRRGDLRLGWNSPVKEIVHPQFINLESRGGLGWLEGFNEFVVRCGLEFAGHPGKDAFIDNTGAMKEMDLTVHGKIGNIPASSVEVLIDSEPPYRLRVRGIVHERMFYGPKLELVTEISTEPGSDTFRIEDRVTNRGAASQEFQLIYHCNYGAPLLQDGAQVVAAVKHLAPMNDVAAKGLLNYAAYAGPSPGFIEQVYLIEPYADGEGKTAILLQNQAGDRGASIAWSTNELPYLTIWKNTAAKEDGYVTGLEPATGFPYNRRVERQAGRLPTLAAGESRSFALDFGVHVGAESVSGTADRIREIQGTRETEVQSEPTVIDEPPP